MLLVAAAVLPSCDTDALAMPQEIPTLQTLALQAVASAVHSYEPEEHLPLPYGGAVEIIKTLVRTGRLRPETLRPLLLSDGSSAEALSNTLGSELASSAPHCRGLGALAAQRLQFAERRRLQQAADRLNEGCALPFGTHRPISDDDMVADVSDLRIAAAR